jgi:hypothetical protein
MVGTTHAKHVHYFCAVVAHTDETPRRGSTDGYARDCCHGSRQSTRAAKPTGGKERFVRRGDLEAFCEAFAQKYPRLPHLLKRKSLQA